MKALHEPENVALHQELLNVTTHQKEAPTRQKNVVLLCNILWHVGTPLRLSLQQNMLNIMPHASEAKQNVQKSNCSNAVCQMTHKHRQI